MDLRRPAVMLLLSVLLTLLFWGPLWCGYGFVGGDLYPYFFPQKAFLADRLHAGEFPLWNSLTGFGYPVLGESQTGAAYPPYLLSYYFLSVNTAYNVLHLLHYVLCFVGTWLLGRRIGLGTSGSILTAIVFAYGWFPPRACLEWAIVTGAWLPMALYCVESFVQTRWWRYAIGLSVVLGLQLLAGHFHLAFITQLLVLGYGIWRSQIRSNRSSDASVPKVASSGSRLLTLLPLLLSLAAGFLIASVQLIPAWELKTRSSRANVGGEHEPSYGHLPPLYASQMFAPWMWYSPHAIIGDETIRNVAELAAPWHWFGPARNLDESLMKSRAGGLTSIATNKVEAHLYCGMVPLGLAIYWLLVGRRKGTEQKASLTKSKQESSKYPIHGELWFWGFAGGLALIYATGWLLPVARYVPGFNFFRGPGRYGIVTTLAIAILAGRGFDRLLEGRARLGRTAILGIVFWSTIGDLWLVSRMVYYAEMVPHPAITLRDQSPIRKLLLAETQVPRLYAPGQNLGNLLGVSCLPVYLGIAPEEYSDRKFAGDGMPKPNEGLRPVAADADFSKWLRDSGVTHLLSFFPLDEGSWQIVLAWQGIDPMLNTAWGRSEPLYLYKLHQSPGLVSIVANDHSVEGAKASTAVQRSANQIVVESTSPNDGTLLLRELEYPGWQVDVDGHSTISSRSGAFREVQVPSGQHEVTWTYRPLSVKVGLAVSVLTILLLAGIGHVRFWHRTWLDRILCRWACRDLPIGDR